MLKATQIFLNEVGERIWVFDLTFKIHNAEEDLEGHYKDFVDRLFEASANEISALYIETEESKFIKIIGPIRNKILQISGNLKDWEGTINELYFDPKTKEINYKQSLEPSSLDEKMKFRLFVLWARRVALNKWLSHIDTFCLDFPKIEVVEKLIKPSSVDVKSKRNNENEAYLYGYAGIKAFLKCGHNKAAEIATNPNYKTAVIKVGRKIIVDKVKLIEILTENQNKPKRKSYTRKK